MAGRERVDGAVGRGVDDAGRPGHRHEVLLDLLDLQLGAGAELSVGHRAAESGEADLQLGDVVAFHVLRQEALSVGSSHAVPFRCRGEGGGDGYHSRNRIGVVHLPLPQLA